MNSIQSLYGWVFTFNPNTGNYRACQREELNQFFSEPETNFLRSKHLETLEEIIIKNEGNSSKIHKLIKGEV